MHEGRLEQVGTPAEVYERPDTRFVAAFLGAANLLPITVRDGQIELAGGTVVATSTAVPNDATWLAIRPERVSFGASESANCLSGVVVQRSYAGETLTHVVRLADGTLMRATAALRHGLNAGQPAVGDAVALSWRPDACIVLTR
jgi:putrescine transport system ATP-binding protein